MLEIYVKKENGDFTTIMEAVEAVPYEEKAIIHIGEGVYTEKIFAEKADITFIGDGVDKTVIEFGDGANDIMPDGSKRGTFRSYTAFFGGKRTVVKNLTIRNTAGDGRVAGQAVAVYADALVCNFENVKMEAHQDTLFCAPLPVSERQKNGFFGPRVMTPRVLTKQYYKNCEITGDVDFIFGGADAVFDDCTIICNNRKANEIHEEGDKDQIGQTNRFVNGYVTAACGLTENIGFIFRNCIVKGEDGCEKASVFLGRPWREQAKTVFMNCKMDDAIAPERYSGWGGITKDEPDTTYGEFGTVDMAGNTVDLSNKNGWVKDIDESVAQELEQKANEVVNACV